MMDRVRQFLLFIFLCNVFCSISENIELLSTHQCERRGSCLIGSCLIEIKLSLFVKKLIIILWIWNLFRFLPFCFLLTPPQPPRKNKNKNNNGLFVFLAVQILLNLCRVSVWRCVTFVKGLFLRHFCEVLF